MRDMKGSQEMERVSERHACRGARLRCQEEEQEGVSGKGRKYAFEGK